MTAAPLRKTANMLWQYLAAVDFFQCESDDKEFAASLALQFLVMECLRNRTSSKLASRKMRNTTWISSVVINRVCGQQMIEITRQPPRPVGENPREGLEGKGCNQQGAFDRDRESEPSRHHTVHHLVLHDLSVGVSYSS